MRASAPTRAESARRRALAASRECLVLGLALQAPVWAQPPEPTFVDVTAIAGFTYQHGVSAGADPEAGRKSGGVAAGDYDRDGWVDLYAVRGDIGPNLLFRNLGNGTFEEVGTAAGLALTGELGAGPTFFDHDGDGWLDLLVGRTDSPALTLFRSRGDGTFEDVTATSGLVTDRPSYSFALGDYDLDGDLDLAQSHWLHWVTPCNTPCEGHLWRNDAGVFTDVGLASGITGFDDVDHTFTPNFADLDNDGRPDLLFASDFQTSRVFLNQGGGAFSDVTDPAVVTDENGMGAAVGDYDNDGDLDWFVTSIYDAPPVSTGTKTGNRLYRNKGDGTFDEVSAAAGVRIGYWGWGACFADFNNDGYLDIFHVNGYPLGQFATDPSRLFMGNGPPDWDFTEKSADFGLVDTRDGRGVVCFDFDRDGDVDIFTANNSDAPRLFRNDGGNGQRFLNVRLGGSGANRHAVGARIWVTAGGMTQLREVGVGSNFESQQPLEEHFGLGPSATLADVVVEWPDGLVESHDALAVDQFLGLAPGLLCGDPNGIVIDGFLHDVTVESWQDLVVEACVTILVGSDVSIAGSGHLTLRAGRSIAIGNGFSAFDDALLTVETLAP